MAVQSYHCCYHCKDRKIGCHSECELYKKEISEMSKLKEKNNEEKQIKYTINRLEVNRRKKLTHRKGVI